MDSKRKTILITLEDLLNGIAHPDQTRAKFFRRVVRGSHRPWDIEPMPAVSIWPDGETPIKAPDTLIRYDLEVQLHLVVTGKETQAANDLEDADALVKEMIETHTTIPGVWKKCEIVKIGIVGVTAQKDVALENVILGIQYDREQGNP